MKIGKFDKAAAGTVDTAKRGTGIEVVWDGFRRCIKAGIVGLKDIRVSRTRHPDFWNDEKCQEEEARLYECRNTNEKMKVEEVFKAMVVYKDKTALEQLDLLKDCLLDVEGLNPHPNAVALGGLAEFIANFKSWKENPDDEYDWDKDKWIEASQIIKEVWNDPKVSTYLLRDIAWILTVNEACNKSYGYTEIVDSFAGMRRVEAVRLRRVSNNFR